MERLVEVCEQEVCIDFLLNCKCRAIVCLRSLTPATPVAFKVQTSSPHKFLVNPPTGLLLPLSYATFQIILKPQSQLPSAYPRSPSDRFLIKTAEYTDSTHQFTSLNSWFSSRPHASTQDLKLKVAFVGPLLLRHAVASGNSDAVRNLIKRQTTILTELSPAESESLLRVATESVNSDDLVNLLLESGLRSSSTSTHPSVHPKWISNGNDQLHEAVLLDRTDEISISVQRWGSTSLDYRDKEGRTPLYVAASRGKIRYGRLLVESGADKDARGKEGRTALYKAAAKGDRPMVEMLLDLGADASIKDDRGRLPLHVARDKGHKEIVEILEFGEAVLMAARTEHKEYLESLIRKGANVNYHDQYGLTALHIAAIKGHREVVLMLIESIGPESMEWVDKEGQTALHLASMSGSLETVQALVSKGANVDAKSIHGVTPLYMAKAMRYDLITQFLIACGASVDENCNAGKLVLSKCMGSKVIM